MAQNPVLKQIDIGPEADARVEEGVPAGQYGLDDELNVAGDPTGAIEMWTYLEFKLPTAPEDVHSSSEDTPYNYKLRLYRETVVGAGNRTKRIHYVRSIASIDETTISWNTRPQEMSSLADRVMDDSTLGYIETDCNSALLRDKLRWDETIFLCLKPHVYTDAQNDRFASKEGLFGRKPILRLEYYQEVPDNVESLEVAPDVNDATHPKLTWDPYGGDDAFSHFEVWRKVGAAAWAHIGSNITEMGAVEFVDNIAGLTENNVTYYRIRVERTDGAYNESGEVWMIRPNVNTFTVSDFTPNVLQSLLFTVSAVAYPATPTPVTQEWYLFYFGTSVQADSSSCRVRELTRYHRYPHWGSQTPKVQIENSLGYKSDLTGLLGGGTLTVTDIVPVAIIRASPVVVEVGLPIRFFGDESYCPAGNQEIAPVNGYQWDKDHVGAFGPNDITTLPYKDYTWMSAGLKTVALLVVDQMMKSSAHVEIQVLVELITSVDLDSALTDGYEVIDADVARTIAISEGMRVKKMTRGSAKIIPVMIGGFAYTDTDVDGIPDDIETLRDIVSGNKMVQILVNGVVHYGSLNFKSHHEAGWLDKFSWVAQILVV